MAKRFNWNHRIVLDNGVKPQLAFDFRDVQRKNPKTENKTPLYMFERGPSKKDLFKEKWHHGIKPGR